MAGNRMPELKYDDKRVRAHVINELRKRVREDRPAEKIRDLSILGLEEQIEKSELYLEGLRAKLDFIKNLDISELEKK